MKEERKEREGQKGKKGGGGEKTGLNWQELTPVGGPPNGFYFDDQNLFAIVHTFLRPWQHQRIYTVSSPCTISLKEQHKCSSLPCQAGLVSSLLHLFIFPSSKLIDLLRFCSAGFESVPLL